MSLTTTYDATNARVVINASAIPFAASVCTVQRSTDQINWTTVRGLGGVAVTANAIAQAYDYEFTPGVVNYYQLTIPYVYWDAYGRTVGSGSWNTPDSGQTLTFSGTVADFSVSGGTGRMALSVVNTTDVATIPIVATDQDVYVPFSNAVTPATSSIKLFADVREISSNTLYRVNVTLTTGGAVQLDAQRFNSGTPTTLQTALTIGGLTPTTAMTLRVKIQGAVLQAKIWATAGSEPAAWAFTVTDGAPLSGTGGVRLASVLSAGNTNTLPVTIQFDNTTISDFADHQIFTANLTPTITAVWLKSLAHPFLNQDLDLAGSSFSADQPTRTVVYPVVGRSLPVAVSDVRSGKSYQVSMRTTNDADATALDALLNSGDVLYLQAPAGFVVPAGGVYVAAGDTHAEVLAPGANPARWVTVTFTEVAAPTSDVTGAQGSWQTVINTYATWTAVMAANADWNTLLTLVGSAADVIVP